MKSLKLYIGLYLFLVLTWSCEETIPIDSLQTESKVVIEALVTNHEGRSYVKLSRSRGFYETGATPRITNADVRVTTSLGETIVFVHNPTADPEKNGYYWPNANFTGEVGLSYTLNVTVDGEVYTATEELLPVTTIDSLKVKVDDEELEDPEVPGRIYSVLFYAKEPQDRVDHYLFKFYRNDSILLDWPTDIYFSDDEVLGETIDDVEIAGYYSEGDVVRVEMFSLTRKAFIFYSDLSNLLNNDGGMFSPPPANPRNNLSNGALGYFQVSAMDFEEMVVTPPGD
ncbi:DUF4249 domain-containing protein [Roseivirga thermotolerans]|uniref:DUF4249 domain-containing protein n=1 Tax=Roseivirga thermotolerans TaxID=1758176 RepID=UPI00273DCC29|nr:DUF4249 domain-containing protein [Roseivirga thermotolerans]